MKISYQQLHQHLENNLVPVYLIMGSEHLLVQESKDLIVRYAQLNGFKEIRRYDANKDFDWHELQISASPSLFCEKALIDLRLSSKPNAATIKILTDYIKKIKPDSKVILSCEKLEHNVQNMKWMSVVDQLGVIVNIPNLPPGQYKQWAEQRLKQNNLSCDRLAIDFLISQTEGNLLALAQEIDKLKLLFGSNPISLSDIINVITDNAKYSVFHFIDRVLEGDLVQIRRTLAKLRQEAVEPILILWAITKEIRLLINIIMDLKGKSWEAIANKYSIWPNRKHITKSCASRHTIKSLHETLLLAEKIDHAIKGLQPGNVWHMIELVAFRLAGIKIG
jgi:DNA polymerase III subunit delta